MVMVKHVDHIAILGLQTTLYRSIEMRMGTYLGLSVVSGVAMLEFQGTLGMSNHIYTLT